MPPANQPKEFWQNVRREGPDQCWPWLLSCKPQGYGIAHYQGKQWIAHRLAYSLAVGSIPAGLIIMHTCDNPPCCNPRHLRPGTVGDNNHDSISKGRQASRKGEHNGNAKLTDKQVRQIVAAEGTCCAIAKRFGVHNTHISRLRRGMQRQGALSPAAIRARGKK